MSPLPNSLKGKRAVVTGAGSGLGKASAMALALSGAWVGLIGRTRTELDQTADEIAAVGGIAIPLVADVTRKQELAEAMRQAAGERRSIDILHANAGINGLWAPVDQIPEDEWDRTLSINLKGTFLTIQQAVPYMREGGGSIVVTSSVNGTRMFSNTGATAYACSKAAQVAMVKMLALELARDRIRVNAVCPGAVESRIEEATDRRGLEDVRLPVEFPQGAVPLTGGAAGAAARVAELVWFLASDLSTHVTGTEVFVDGGQSLLQG